MSPCVFHHKKLEEVWTLEHNDPKPKKLSQLAEEKKSIIKIRAEISELEMNNRKDQ